MKVAIYCRTSKTEQNPENQKLELEHFAKAMNYNYSIFEEQESTRKTRPIKNNLFQEALQKKWDLILVWKLDRWARSMQELINDLELLRQNNVQFRTLKENLCLDNNPTNNLMINILSSFAQFERDIIRERTMAGLDRARTEGKKLGRPFKKSPPVN
ncbi:MAG: recombinase family protein [Candidatus Omnitrophica bacterium]|jgi:DNA invertase Pin-like site-specific DNA recombinase|nr:recombinase family protein [Candidatus Omnitrophota bacterium]